MAAADLARLVERLTVTDKEASKGGEGGAASGFGPRVRQGARRERMRRPKPRIGRTWAVHGPPPASSPSPTTLEEKRKIRWREGDRRRRPCIDGDRASTASSS